MPKSSSYYRIATNNNNYSSMVDNLYKQSELVGSETAKTTVFRDGSTQWHVAFPSSSDETRDVAMHDDVALGDFFQRPIYSAAFTWDPAAVSPFFQAFDPWTTFFSNTRVSNRVSNFQLMSCKLRVKFMVSGNGFYYGRLLAHYDPLSSANTLSGYGSGASTRTCIQASQGLHAFIDPTESQGCEFTLPFIYPYDAVDLTATGVLSTLGSMYVRELEPLKHANGSTGPINITVFIWAEDMKLSVPTTSNFVGVTAQSGVFDDVTPQAGDEYGTGPVSMMASAVASTAGKLRKTPMIGKYARATEIASGAMGQIARLFGFSRPLAIDVSKTVKPDLISKLAVTDIADHSSKLTVDSKQELTIDPAVIGIEAPDELVLSHLASRQSYLTQFPFTTTATAGTLLWEARVHPTMYDTNGTLFYPTASAWIAQAFGFWRGTMKYRFQIVASSFHRGRIAITWDPNIMSGTVVPNLVYTRIVDLADERDFTFEVPWGNARHFLKTTGITTIVPFVTALHYATADSDNSNGVVSVTVMNELTAPSSLINNDIRINVFTSMCDDAEFAAPANLSSFTYAPSNGIQVQSGTFDDVTPQAGEEDAVVESNSPEMPAAVETMGPCMDKPDATSAVYFGESIQSFRSLLKRYNFWGSIVSPSATAGLWSSKITNFPPHRGYYLGATHSDGTNPVNYCNLTMINFLAPGFLAMRGGIRRKYLLNTTISDTQTYMSAKRLVDSFATPNNYFTTNTAPITTTTSARSQQRYKLLGSNAEGAAITSSVQQPVLEIELPYYKNVRFDNPRQPSGRTAIGGFVNSQHQLNIDQPAAPTYVDIWVAAAEDFTLVGFQGFPPVYFGAL